MAVNLGEVYGAFDWKIGDGVKNVAKHIRGVGDDSDRQTARARKGFEGVTESVKKTGSGLSGLIGTLAKFGFAAQGIKLLTGAFQGLTGGLISGNKEFERYQTQLSVLLGGVDAATERIATLSEFGQKTPFELPGIITAEKILLSFGLTAENAQQRFGFAADEIRTIAGDVAAGTGQAFDSIAGYIGRFSAGSVGEAIMRFQELGIVTRQELQGMGLEFSKSGELLSPLPEATEILLQTMKGKFGGMMEAQSATFEGMVSNLQDWWWETKKTVSEPIFDVAKQGLGSILELLQGPEVKAATQTFAAGLSVITEGLAGLVTEGVDSVRSFGTEFGGGLQQVAFNAVEWGVNIVSSLAEGFVEGAASALTTAMDFISGLLSSWLAPGSPPKVAPDLPEWGSQAMGEYLKGFSDADFTALETLQRPLREALGLIFGKDQGAASAAFQQLNAQIAESLAGGGLTPEVLESIRSQTGEYGDLFVDLAEKQAALQGPLDALTAAQDRYNAAQEKQQAMRDQVAAERKALGDMRKESSRGIEDLKERHRVELEGAKLQRLNKRQLDAIKERQKGELTDAQRAAELAQRDQEDKIEGLEGQVDAQDEIVSAAQKEMEAAKLVVQEAEKQVTLQERILQQVMAQAKERQRQLQIEEQMETMTTKLSKGLSAGLASGLKAALGDALGGASLGQAMSGAGATIKTTLDTAFEGVKAGIREKLFGTEGAFDLGSMQWIEGQAGVLSPLIEVWDKLGLKWGEVKKSWGEMVAKIEEKMAPFLKPFKSVGGEVGSKFLENLGKVGGIAAAAAVGVGVLSLALGVLTGPVGIIMLIVAAIAALKTAWETDFGGMRTTITTWWYEDVVPILEDIGAWINEKLIPWWTDLKDQAVIAWEKVASTVQYVYTNYIKPRMDDIKTALETVTNFLNNPFVAAWNLAKGVVETVTNWVRDTAIPKINDWRDAIGNVWQKVIDLWDKFKAFKDSPVVTWLKDWAEKTATAWDGIATAVQNVYTWFANVIEKIKDLIAGVNLLPDFLKPGSPTPFELGWRGIADALAVTRNELRGLSVEFGGLSAASIPAAGPSLAAAGVPAGGGGGTVVGGGININFTGPITVKDADEFIDTLSERLRSLERPLRDMGMLAASRGMTP